jgi:integrase/recombinase XerD
MADSLGPGDPLADAIAAFLTDLAQANRSVQTRRAYAADLRQFAAGHRGALETVTPGVLRAFFATVAHLSPATRAQASRAGQLSRLGVSPGVN